jgi:hypothetical protein
MMKKIYTANELTKIDEDSYLEVISYNKTKRGAEKAIKEHVSAQAKKTGRLFEQ